MNPNTNEESIQNDLVIIIMAGGNGKRMESDLPKVLHDVGGYPMIVNIICESKKLCPKKILIVVGQFRPIIESTIRQYVINLDLIEFIDQSAALGTGHAVMCCRSILESSYMSSTTLVLSGDVPLIKTSTMFQMLHRLKKAKIMVTTLTDPFGYGRIVENDGVFDKIVEEKDCDPEQKKILKVNCGIYAFKTSTLCKYLPHIQNKNSQKEFYLTDIIEIIKNDEQTVVDMYEIPADRQIEIYGVNTRQQLHTLIEMHNSSLVLEPKLLLGESI